MKNQIILSISLLIILLNVPKTLSQSPASAPAANPPPSSAAQVAEIPGPLDVVKILEKAGRFTVFLRLLRSTQENTELYQQLNETHNSATVFAPSDGAFSGLKAGTLNSLSDGDKSELVKFHIVPFAIASTQFQTVSNPIRTQAGSGNRLSMNITTDVTGSSVNISTGIVNTTISGTVYADSRLSIYQVDKVLLPLDIFTPKPPPPAPAPAPALEKPTKKGGDAAAAESPAVPKNDDSGANKYITDTMKQSHLIFTLFSLLFLSLNATLTTSLSPASSPVSKGPLNIIKILQKAGHFSHFIRLIKTTQEDIQFASQLNASQDGITIFAPTDGAFSAIIKAGTLNALSDQEKIQLVQFHAIPRLLSTPQFQTVSNPLKTLAGSGKQFQLNVTTSDSMVNVTSGLTNTTVSGIVYMDDQLAIYQVDKVLLPKEVFSPKSLAPAPAPAKHVKDESADSPSVAKDASDGELDCVVDKLNVFMVGVATVAAVVLSFL
ncbi:Fasciclin-like arabinogalactan protein 11 [Linum perenne]